MRRSKMLKSLALISPAIFSHIVSAQMNLSRGMCNFDPCVKAPVAAKCIVDVAVVGVATCQCPEGFYGDGKPEAQGGTGCVNIDECASGTDTCDAVSQMCVDRDPLVHKGMKFQCACKTGFAPSANGMSCEDINECLQPQLNVCDEQSTMCRNFAGGYECTCKNQSQLFDTRSNSCRDVNECTDFEGSRNPCDPKSTVCVDKTDGVGCQCRPGFQPIQGVATACTDIDECALELDECPKDRSVCRNIVGDYECQCSEELGYTGVSQSNKMCTNLNECERWPHICGPATPCCGDLPPELGGYSCVPSIGGSSIGVDTSLPTRHTASAHFGMSPYHPHILTSQTGPRRGMLEKNSDASKDTNIIKRLSSATKDDESVRSLQVVNRLTHLRPASISPTTVFRAEETATCPAGYRHVDEISRAHARQKTAEAFRTTFSGASRASPDQVANGIATNAGIIANEFATWYNSLAHLPTQVAYASQNATHINPMNDAANVLKAGEAMVSPFVPGMSTNNLASGMGIGGIPGMNSALGSTMQNPAVAAGLAAVAGGAIVGAATKGGPGDSFALDRSGLGRLIAYDQV